MGGIDGEREREGRRGRRENERVRDEKRQEDLGKKRKGGEIRDREETKQKKVCWYMN